LGAIDGDNPPRNRKRNTPETTRRLVQLGQRFSLDPYIKSGEEIKRK
jgi:hypothetical protein